MCVFYNRIVFTSTKKDVLIILHLFLIEIAKSERMLKVEISPCYLEGRSTHYVPGVFEK